MKTIALISQKGGAGKSTLARQFSVLAGEEGPSWIIDRDPQQTSARWHERRQDGDTPPEQPGLIDLGGTTLTAAVAALKAQPGTLFIDTRPAVTEPEAEAARLADLALVPVRPSLDDLEAIGATLDMLRRVKTRTIIIINAAKNERRAIEARAALSVHTAAVCPHHLADRAVYLDATVAGLGVGELRGAAAVAADAELRRVWTWIMKEAAE
ncbi:plasmid partitioning-family protein [Methylobacterium sp. J-092]|uniref:nucleotide-binding protein n=1 Tax=Methylobacterium sp. J-092 TaxID=2836667 RepID=UPI001FBA3B7A|nr:plasmid partitioning-family protein [Methylobacterium sp. J-092]MCJ2009176.1 plasmid partitioning-family protein [Methylobacterium sp. J-092]